MHRRGRHSRAGLGEGTLGGDRPPRLRSRSRNELPSLLSKSSGSMLAGRHRGRVDIDGGARASRTMVAANAIPGSEPLPLLPEWEFR